MRPHQRSDGHPSRWFLVRLALEGARVVHRVDVEVASLEVRKHQPIRLAGPRDGRRERHKARQAGIHVGQLVNLLVPEIVEEEVAGAVPVG